MNCSKCSVELVPVFESHPYRRRTDDFTQYRDALVIELFGGYGMFIDPIVDYGDDKQPRYILCKLCAEAFTEYMNTHINQYSHRT